LEIRLLGELQLFRDGRRMELPASRKTRALLAYLIATGTPQRRDRLCDLLWEGPDDPRGELRWSLSKIRPLVDDGEVARLVTERDRVAFVPQGAEIDLFNLQAVLRDIDQASLDTLISAAGMFRGNFLEGIDLPACYRFQEWCLAERERLSALRIAALNAAVERSSDRPSEALVHARALLAADPLSEEAHATVVQLLGQRGRRRDALAQYEQARKVLQREHGMGFSGRLERARHGLENAKPDCDAEARRPAAAPVAADRVVPEDAASRGPDFEPRNETARNSSANQRAGRGDPPLALMAQASRGILRGASGLPLALAATGLLLIAIGTGTMTWALFRATETDAGAIDRVEYPLPERPSIAVLPFTDLAADGSGALMTQGLTESLVNALARSRALFVIAHRSSSNYAGEPAAVSLAAEELGVHYVVEGSLRRAGDRVRVTAQLVDAARGTVLWSGRYLKPADDLLGLEDTITAQIAHSLDVRIIRGSRHSSGGTDQLDAWAAYNEGQTAYRDFTRAGNVRARYHFLRALELDPDYAEALIALALTHLLALFETPAQEWADALARIAELKDRAHRIAPHMPRLFELESLMALTQGDHERALSKAETMARLDPNGAESHYTLGRMRFFVGQYARAIDSLRTAERINPNHSAPYASHKAFSHLALDQVDPAIEVLESVVERWPDYGPAHAYLAIAYQLAERSAEAREQVALMPDISPPEVTVRSLERRFSPMQDREAADRIIEAARRAGISG
jgi:TolB-like protein/DNA-binding SARP family transcriptional activator